MAIKQDLRSLLNTLYQIETKGQSTIIMGDCLRFLEQLINKTPDEKSDEETEQIG